MATCRIDPVRVELLRILISCEPAILSKISFQDGSGRKTGKKLQVREDGTVIFYCGKGPLWWQRCCNDYELVSIVDVALRVADVITGSHGTRNELAFDGITKSILDEAIKKKDYDCVVDILFDSMRNCSDGALHSKYINQKLYRSMLKRMDIVPKKRLLQRDLYQQLLVLTQVADAQQMLWVKSKTK